VPEGLNVLYGGYSELREIPARQVPGEPRRRWFMSANCDLIVWLDGDHQPLGFQFCYDKDLQEHALTWMSKRGFSHLAVDVGSFGTGTPLLVANGAFDPARVLAMFRTESVAVPPDYVEMVAERIGLLVPPGEGLR
jgi:hypothetical protein